MVLVLYIVGGLALLTWLQVSHVRRVRSERRQVLRAADGVLADGELTQRGMDYPAVSGFYRGRQVKLALLVDNMTLRQLPYLWLVVKVVRPLAVSTPVDILLRPRPTDIVSAVDRFPVEHPPLPDWPPDIRVATMGVELPPRPQMDAVTPLVLDARVKAVLFGPGGLRIVRQLARGELGHYRVVRRTKFKPELERAELVAILDAAIYATDAIAGGSDGRAPSATIARRA